MPELPTGTVTFLFTDIEGSTRLLDELGGRYADALEEHGRVLRAALARHDGVEVDTQGDAFFAVFRSAREAVAAAAEAQHALELPVRMGLHTGEAVVAPTGYVGMDVHRAARICAAAHGGQVLLSQTTRDLVGSELPAELDLSDVGDHRLKDLAEAQRLHQLVIAGLPSEFPPLETLDRRPTNLPVQATPLIGRERELEDAGRLLRGERVRLLTLTGPGGSGKTRLGLQLAADLLDDFIDGVFFVGLAGIEDATLVVPTVAQVLGVKERGGRPLLDSLADHLRHKRALLMLDNMEQVLEAGPGVGALLSSCPAVKVLVTSRAPLHLSGEQEYEVQPLTESAAVELFVERARAVRAGFEVDGNREAIDELCLRLDRLPLAIELAASRTRLFPPEMLLARLQRRLPLLIGGPRDLPERQRTLEATIDWSYDLLSDEDRTLFRRLAVFVDGWELGAAEAVCGSNVLVGLESLVDNSLVRADERADGGPRFAMLETIREYAFEQLAASGEDLEVRRRHAEHYLALAEQAGDSPEPLDRRLACLDRELGNLRAAIEYAGQSSEPLFELRLAIAFGQFCRIRGHLKEGLISLEHALARGGREAPALRARACHSAAALAWRQGDFVRSGSFAEQSLSLARAGRDRSTEAGALHGLGVVAEHEGDYDRAKTLYEQAAGLHRELGETRELASCIHDLGLLAWYQRDLAGARPLLEEGLSLHRATDSPGVANSLLDLGLLAAVEGRYGDAGPRLREGLALARARGWKEGIAYGLEGLAVVAAGQNDPEQAARLLGAAGALEDEIGLPLLRYAREIHDGVEATARGTLGAQRFSKLRDCAAGMEIDELVG